ncbi:hypothetical protein LTS08_000167 [Lithohypha guttulata]|nr:hypothetical protein LTS08_000167 [Lithohypha guttulata]
MEAVGALASSLQIVALCGQVTVTIVKWVESVRTVDERIDAFVHEVNTLRMTYESLSRSLREPSMLEAAKITNRDVGGHLWLQMSKTLQDCERTMNAITNVLRKIQASGNFLRPFLKQLRENLHSGELVRLREQIVMFNQSLQLPMQMMTLTMQLRQQEMTTAHQMQLNDQLNSLRIGIMRIERISTGLRIPQKKGSLGGSTLAGDSPTDRVWFDNMETYIGTAKKFLDSASVAASTRSAASVRPNDDNPVIDEGRRGSAFAPLTAQKFNSISMYVDDLPRDTATATPLASESLSVAEHGHGIADDIDDSDDLDFQLLQTLLFNGHAEVDQGDYANAEDNYREAMSMAQRNNFGSRLACSTADIALMLGECLARQQKFDEAISLLQPLAQQAASRPDVPESSAASTYSQGQRSADRGQILAANHVLGEVYLKKPDLVNAEVHAVQAWKGRSELLGPGHPKTIESVKLVIEMYKAKGRGALAKAHERFLQPAQPVQESHPVTLSSTSSHGSSLALAEPTQTTETLPTRTRFFSSPFKRAEKSNSSSTPVPLNRNSLGSSPLSTAEELSQLSTSPRDIPSLRMSPNARPIEKTLRKESSNPDGPVPQMQRWMTTSDIVDQYMGRPEGPERTRSSLTRIPTIYAGLSRTEMEQIFNEVAALCKDGKTSKAVDKGIQFMRKYDPDSAIFVHRKSELKRSIERSRSKGLSGTGAGFSPLHFFCSLNFEALTEIDILLQQGADVDAVAYKAGYGETDPFISLSLAIERGHSNVVRMLLHYGSSWRPALIQSARIYNPGRNSLHPLLSACSRGYSDIVEILLDHGMELREDEFARLSWHGNSLLHEACFRCDLKMVATLMNHARQKEQLKKSGYSFVGRPGQQDVFGVTPLMYAVDMRDNTGQRFKDHKLKTRVTCLKILLEEETELRTEDTENGEVVVDHPRKASPDHVATELHIQDKEGNTVHWYADEVRGGDAELKVFLDEQSRRSHLIDF